MHVRLANAPARSLLIAALATLAVLAWQLAVVAFVYRGNVAGLFFTGDRFPPPPELRPTTPIIHGTQGYDGQFYRYIAHDPLFTKDYAAYIDDARLRYRRILVPGLARAVSVTGLPVEWAYVGVVLGSVFAGVYWCCRWMLDHALPVIYGAVFLLVPGTLASIERMLVDGTLTALAVGFFWYSGRHRWGAAALCCAVAALTRETGFLLVCGGAVAAVWERRLCRALLFAAAGAPAIAWYVIVARSTPPSAAHGIMTSPLVGLFARLFVVRSHPDAAIQTILRTLDVLSVLGLLGALGAAVLLLRYERSAAVRAAAVLFLILGCVLGGPAHMTDAYGFARPVSPLIAWIWMRAAAERRWLLATPPVTMSLSVGAYLVQTSWTAVQQVLHWS
ncbi:MAG TPA: hypothetical protein VFL57_11745 [Bryobacteraceae bacterium]|nr:hypothetical protein [Bryobacteraceae bacterium]